MAAIDMLTGSKDPEKMLLALGIDQDWAELVGAAMRSKPTQRISLPTFRGRIPQPKGPVAQVSSAPPPPLLPSRAEGPSSSSLLGWLLLALALLTVAIFFPLK